MLGPSTNRPERIGRATPYLPGIGLSLDPVSTSDLSVDPFASITADIPDWESMLHA